MGGEILGNSWVAIITAFLAVLAFRAVVEFVRRNRGRSRS
jgi:hypothetical protein